uniref:Cathelicidin-related antimicrobial peptide n=1 Tax=Crotalus durissus terrificus TaxID=8732 RepID=U5KJZ1_CRODC|nr:cathelicidin-like peptide isoform precursor 2 [Crotalus durissus cascavella]
MQGFFWKTLLVLAVCGTPASLAHRPLSYGEALELAVSVYNGKAGEASLYRLLEAVPQPEWDPSSEGSQQLNFTLKETACQVEEERSLEECGFQEDGDQPKRVKRFKKFFKKVKKSVKKRLKKIFKKPMVIGVSIPF